MDVIGSVHILVTVMRINTTCSKSSSPLSPDPNIQPQVLKLFPNATAVAMETVPVGDRWAVERELRHFKLDTKPIPVSW